jgi:hypothetical protein
MAFLKLASAQFFHILHSKYHSLTRMGHAYEGLLRRRLILPLLKHAVNHLLAHVGLGLFPL